MSTAAQVRSAWTSVFAHASIQALTTKTHAFDLRAMLEQSMSHLALGMYAQEIHFFQWTVLKSFQFHAINNQAQYQFQVGVDYFRECDISGANYNAIVDGFETLWSVIRSAIGERWSSTVDFWQPQQDVPSIVTDVINNQEVWRGTMSFIGTKTTSL